MNVVKEIQRINAKELATGAYSETGSWHAEYKNSAWIFVGSLPFDLTEGDIVCIFSQYGEVLHVELIRDAKEGKSKGFGFVKYEDQRSTILAVDNLNGANILGRTIRVDHSHTGPRKPKRRGEEEEESEEEEGEKMNVAPQMIEMDERTVKESAPKASAVDVDEEDPMAAYFKEKHEKKKSKKKDKSEKRHKHKSSSSHNSSSRRRRSNSRDRDDHKSSRRYRGESRSRERQKSSRYSSDDEYDRSRHRSSKYDNDDEEKRYSKRPRHRDDDDRRRPRYSSRERERY